MSLRNLFAEAELAALAKRFRQKSGHSRAEAARNLGVSHVSLYRAEENPEISLFKLRVRMIEKYSPFAIEGPLFRLIRQKT